MSILCDTTFLLITISRSSVKVKVKYQGRSFRKNGRCRGIHVSQKHLVVKNFVNLKSAQLLTGKTVWYSYKEAVLLSNTTDFDSFKLKEFADDHFKFDKNDRKFSELVENTVGKGEIAHHE